MRIRVLSTLMVAVFSTSVGLVALGQVSASASPKSCYSTCPTTTTLSASSNSLTFGSENTEVFSVTVAPRTSGVPGVPTGTVVVKAGWTTLCTITLSAGAGSCSPGASALPGAHHPYLVIARYGGDSSFSRSWSNFVSIAVGPVPNPPPHGHHHGGDHHGDGGGFEGEGGFHFPWNR